STAACAYRPPACSLQRGFRSAGARLLWQKPVNVPALSTNTAGGRRIGPVEREQRGEGGIQLCAVLPEMVVVAGNSGARGPTSPRLSAHRGSFLPLLHLLVRKVRVLGRHAPYLILLYISVFQPGPITP